MHNGSKWKIYHNVLAKIAIFGRLACDEWLLEDDFHFQ